MRTPRLTSLILVCVVHGRSSRQVNRDARAAARRGAARPRQATRPRHRRRLLAAPPPGEPPACAGRGAPYSRDAAAADSGSGSHPEPASLPGAPPAVIEPAAVTEVGVQRLPGSAYPEPQTRGLKYGSLWLTFHGLQWPYMPSCTNGERFVHRPVGLGLDRHLLREVRPLGRRTRTSRPDRIKYWKQQARMLLRVTPTYSFDTDWFIQGQVELVGTGDQTIAAVGRRRRRHRRSLAARRPVEQVGLPGRPLRGLGGLSPRHGARLQHLRAQGRGRAGRVQQHIAFYGLTDNQFRPSGAAGNFAVHYYPLPFLRFELLGMAGSFSGPAYAGASGGDPRPRLAQAQGGHRVPARRRQPGVGSDRRSRRRASAARCSSSSLPHVEFGFNAAQGTVWNIDRNGHVQPQGEHHAHQRRRVRERLERRAPAPAHVRRRLADSPGPRTRTTSPRTRWTSYWLYQGFVAAQYVASQRSSTSSWSAATRAVTGSLPATIRRIVFDDEMYSVRLRFSFYF